MTLLKVRSDCRYNLEELAKILPFKEDFIAGTISDRILILKRDILPAIFNYWQGLGKEYDSIQSKILSKV